MPEKFYFAWVDANQTFNPAIHNVEDEDVYSFTLSQDEGDFASLELVIKNPRIGLLNPGRKVWAFFAFDDGVTITPQFYGRLIAVPNNIFDTLVTLQFTARPTDFVAQKEALAETLRERPYFDDMLVSPDAWEDPDVVLEAQSKLWHIDPVTHVVTVSDVIVPEDGVAEFTDEEHFYDSMSITLRQVPLRSVKMVVTVPWTQTASGAVDISPEIRNMFPGRVVTSFTFQGLMSDWPKEGQKMTAGWEVISGVLEDVSFMFELKHAIPIVFDISNQPIFTEGSIIFPVKESGKIWGGVEGAGFDVSFEISGAILGYGRPTLLLGYNRSAEFGQVITFTLTTDQQSTATDPGEDEALLLTLSCNKASDPGRDGTIPIGDVRRRNFTHTDRGVQLVEHCLLIARANLIIRSRCVQTTIATDYKTGVSKVVSLRKSAIVHDTRIPGGQAVGKIVSYSFSLDGDTGEALCELTMGSTVGYGGAYVPVPGTPGYVDEGYVDREYQEYVGELAVADTQDIQYEMPPVEFFDDGIDFMSGLPGKGIRLLSLTNPASSQGSTIEGYAGMDQTALSQAIQAIPTQVHLLMRAMEGGPFQSEVVVSVSDLIIPKQIDLEAASV